MESVLLPGETRDFSENNLITHSGYSIGACNGGDSAMSMAYMARWAGPINDSDDPNSGTSSPKVRAGPFAVQKHAQEMLALPDRASSTDNDNIIIFRDEELNTKDSPVPAAGKKLFAFLSGQPYARAFPAVSGSQLIAFIAKEASAYKKSIGAAAADELINRTVGDLWLIASEIKKLAYRTDEKTITLSDVREMTAAIYDQNIFALTDALSDKNKKLALRLLAEQYAAGASDEYLLAMLIRQFKILFQIRTALDNKISPAKMAGELKLHPFVVQKGSRQAANFSAAVLRDYLNRLLRLDWLNKKGQTDLTTELSLLLAGL